MRVFRNPDTLPDFQHAVITIGTFDGVHMGHQQIIKQLLEESKTNGGETVLITFHPHPRKVLNPSISLMQLTTLEEKIALLKKYGIHNMVVVPFTQDFAALTAMQYIEDFLVKKFKPAKIIIGYDHKFGKQREGNFQLLELYAHKYHYEVKEIDEQIINDAIVSSTRIREALQKGDVATANQYLGYCYFFKGLVVEGNKLGRTIGFPTANIALNDEDKLIPGNGVYTVTAQLEGENRTLRGMMNIGTRPTVDGSRRMIEVNLFDFNEDIYGRHLQVWLHHYIRSEIKFSGLEALQRQLHIDKQQSINHLNDLYATGHQPH